MNSAHLDDPDPRRSSAVYRRRVQRALRGPRVGSVVLAGLALAGCAGTDTKSAAVETPRKVTLLVAEISEVDVARVAAVLEDLMAACAENRAELDYCPDDPPS
jgi:hypothetical protein